MTTRPPSEPQGSPRDGPGELERFKTEINLTQLMAGFGYERDRRASSRNSCAMVHPDGDKLIVTRGHDGHWVYFSVRDHHDNGTAIDFVQRRTHENLGQVRKRLREWVNSPSPTALDPQSYAQDLEPITRDLALVQARYAAMRPLGDDHPYLVEQRRLPVEILSHPMFSDRIRIDERGNAVFPHFDRSGLCGYEIKNDGYTGFARGGSKGLWGNRKGERDTRLVIAETAIDALSYAAVRGVEGSRFVSIAGELNPAQPALLVSAIQKLPTEGEVVMALDHDAGGDHLANQITEAFARAGRIDLSLIDDRPEQPGADWNDVLRARASDQTPPPLPPGLGV